MHISISNSETPFYSEGFIVRFFKTDGTQWVANFQPGWTKLKAVIALADTPNLLVIALGTCYLMDPDQTTPLSVFGVGYSNFFSTSDGRFVLQDQTDLTIVEPDGSHWRTARISLDGLKEVSIEKNIVTGLAFNPTHEDDEWVYFHYDIDSKKLLGGSY